MPGIATQFQILDLTRHRLEVSGDPALMQIAQVIKDNPVYANLGAAGPAWADFIPSDPPPDPKDPIKSDPNPYSLLWKMIFGIIGGDPGFFSVLERIRDILDKLDKIAHDEDCDKLKAIQDGTDPTLKLDDIQTEATKLSQLVSALDPLSSPTIPTIAGLITDRLKPNVNTASPIDPVPAGDTWQPRDFLHWKRSGAFVRALLGVAAKSKDQRLLAYAYGYIVSYSGNVCGSSFINSVVGGPARTQWWRQRFAKNFVDAWVYGFYNQSPRPTVMGDIPVPPYPTWPSLCQANLQQRIELAAMDPVNLMELVKTAKPFPKLLPDDFAQLWFDSFQAAYASPLPPNIKPEALNGAYVMLWMVLWFQTSGAVLGCDPQPPMRPPDDCGDDPSSLDPFTPAPGGGPTPPPAMDTDLKDTTAEVCGIILAILGGLLFLAGAGAAGAGAIAGAIALLDCSSIVEWEKLRCELYWYRMYLYNGVKGLHKLLSLAGFDYPYSSALAEDQEVLQLLGNHTFESGKNLVKSRVQDGDFPSKPWDGSLDTFNQRPTATKPGFETPRTIACYNEVYPDFFIDDDAGNPLLNGDVKTAGGFPFRPKAAAANLPIQFGNAVANAVDLFANLTKAFPNWNLDADRGLAYMTWQFKGFYNPDSVQIQPDP